MRHRILLVEYNRDIEARKLAKDLCSAADIDTTINVTRAHWQRDVDKQFQYASNILAAIETKDPTPNKMYMQWLGRMYANSGRVRSTADDAYLKFEDINRQDRLTKYHRLKLTKKIKPEHADINRFKTYHDFEDVTDHYEDPPDPNMAKGEADVVFKDSTVTVVWLHDQQAACYYGQGTRWCTAATKGWNAFDGYAQENRLLAFLPKTPKHDKEKYQLAIPKPNMLDDGGTEIQLMNEQDHPIGLEELVDRFPTAVAALTEHPEFKYFFERAVVLWPEDKLREAMRTVVGKLKPRLDQAITYLLSEFMPRRASEDDRDIDFDGNWVTTPKDPALIKRDMEVGAQLINTAKERLDQILSIDVLRMRELIARHFGTVIRGADDPVVMLVYIYRNEFLDDAMRLRIGRPLYRQSGTPMARHEMFEVLSRVFGHVVAYFNDPDAPLKMDWPDANQYDD